MQDVWLKIKDSKEYWHGRLMNILKRGTLPKLTVLWGTNMFECNPKEVVGFDEVISSERKK